MTIWMKVTLYEYEFPLLVCDSIKTLADKSGVKIDTIRSKISKYEHGLIPRTQYRKVVIDDTEEETC